MAESTKSSTCRSEPTSSADITINSTMAERLLWIRWLGFSQVCVDAWGDAASVDWPNQKFFVARLKAGDCITDSMWRQAARRDKEERELNLGRRRQQWWSNTQGAFSSNASLTGLGDAPDVPKANGKGKKARRREERVLHALEPWRRQRRRLDHFLHVGRVCVSFGSSGALCQANASSSSCRARTKLLP